MRSDAQSDNHDGVDSRQKAPIKDLFPLHTYYTSHPRLNARLLLRTQDLHLSYKNPSCKHGAVITSSTWSSSNQLRDSTISRKYSLCHLISSADFLALAFTLTTLFMLQITSILLLSFSYSNIQERTIRLCRGSALQSEQASAFHDFLSCRCVGGSLETSQGLRRNIMQTFSSTTWTKVDGL